MLQPKRTNYRKAHKGRIKGNAKGGTELNFGTFGLKALEPERVTADLDATYAHLNRDPRVDKGNIGTIGFCWGGGQSFRYATNNPHLRAVVVAYGTLINTVVNFLIVAFAVFLLVKQVNRLMPPPQHARWELHNVSPYI